MYFNLKDHEKYYSAMYSLYMYKRFEVFTNTEVYILKVIITDFWGDFFKTRLWGSTCAQGVNVAWDQIHYVL